jgi:biotin operon repressor
MLVSTENLCISEIITLEQRGYKIEMDADSGYATVTKETKNEPN